MRPAARQIGTRELCLSSRSDPRAAVRPPDVAGCRVGDRSRRPRLAKTAGSSKLLTRQDSEYHPTSGVVVGQNAWLAT